MLKPREADIPALFLLLVVLPLVTYVLLGKWNEATKKKARISMLAELAAEEALRVEAIATASVIPIVLSSKTGFHECARCFRPAATRCSRCKSVRYCSGKCQIIHWRQGHKQECQQLDISNSNSSASPPSTESAHQRVLLNEKPFSGFELKEHLLESIPPDISIHPPMTTSTAVDTFQHSMVGREHSEKRVSFKFNRMASKSEETTSFDYLEETNSRGATTLTPGSISNCSQSKEPPVTARKKLGKGSSIESFYETPIKQNLSSPPMYAHGCTVVASTMDPPYRLTTEHGVAFKASSASSSPMSLYSEKNGINGSDINMDFMCSNGNFLGEELPFTNETFDLSSCNEKISYEASTISESPFHAPELAVSTSQRSMLKASRERLFAGTERKTHIANESKIPRKTASTDVPTEGSSIISKISGMKMVGRKKLPKLTAGCTSDSLKKNKVLFPYEELVKLFNCELWNLSPRGLLNCGNSCYANAVLQCLTCTKPLSVYLLRRSHSRTCWVRDWCLMCELEQHVSMLREGAGPLSASRILSHMQNIGCRMGGGDQEDAHEFLRLLVTSMQSICLEGLGGEKELDPRLQETTLVQQIFGGHLRSKVKCLRCHHESERYEKIMDLTLEILGWVESLEDALTQFTAPEDLDGENMYRCGRCATYVKARKQLNVHEAPNILTIVLKRFQTGKYGKINKCISFPDMLDMIPFMTGTGDSPPLYMLYGVVVHLDTLNASFSGHYVSYVKDLQGMWFRIDDTKVEPVPVGQVMSEGAYILFYSRSYPRPPRVYTGRSAPFQAPASAKQCMSKTQKPSRDRQSKQNGLLFAPEHSSPHYTAKVGDDPNEETGTGLNGCANDQGLRTASRNVLPTRQMYTESVSTDFSDATSSDWSLFTSSDESSFTTESTRDSFSTVDYSDPFNIEPISSIFGTFCAPDYSNSTISCTKFLPCKPQTRYFLESSGFVLDSSMPTQPVGSVHNGKNLDQVTVSLTESRPSANNCSMFVRYGSNPEDSFVQTPGCL
ncbi:ubiquitin C-terminal hydrolase 15-like [Magnolia sinica]|uniref:ubiquitin C-terminal hydrolase 15-like n=1 Tax=Magnolia sinica TaxID=86752 RepID=UPI002657D4CE|nr:ubiquitin C-terminal hydrolase 15-like [Magnolia sinica]XP_058095330.1 ubiquitin C-terminal hydrolase 15-like [Magnolia sinica]